MSDLTEFLKARLDEDERTAKGLAGATRIIGGGPDFYGAGGLAAEDFWERFDPARVLREVKAKRAILGEYAGNDMDDLGYTNALGFAVSHLAAVYSDHPDYQQEWRP
jgi:hypothetical protein